MRSNALVCGNSDNVCQNTLEWNINALRSVKDATKPTLVIINMRELKSKSMGFR